MTLVSSDLLPVNVTLAAYGAAIVLGGSVLGLAIYFLATQVRQHQLETLGSWVHIRLVLWRYLMILDFPYSLKYVASFKLTLREPLLRFSR